MSRKLTAQEVEEVPETASVSDYDELPDAKQNAVRRLVTGESAEESIRLDSDIVRFVDYYRIDSRGRQASD